MSRAPRTAAATEAVKRYADERAASNPTKVTRAVRTVRRALDLARTDPAIREAIAQAPPFSPSQIAELRALLPPAGGAAA